MDKKSLSIIIVLGVIIIGIVVSVFIYDAGLNTNILTVNGVKYDQTDFESYLKVWQYENGNEPIDVEERFQSYQLYKLYSQYVEKYNVELESGEKLTALTETEKENLTKNYNISENEYTRVKTEITLVDKLYRDLFKYYKISDEEYNEHKVGNEDKFKMYDYRVMQVNIPEPSGEQFSGDVSGDVSGEKAKEKQRLRDLAKVKVEEALAKVKSGDSFEEVAKNYGSMRIVLTADGYNVTNGNLEKVSGLYMEDYVYDKNILDALKTLKPGEYSKIYEDDAAFTFVYLENIREDLDKGDKERFLREIANEHIQGAGMGLDIHANKIPLKKIKLQDLIPALSKKEENKPVDQNVITSGEKHEEKSGDVVSGEIK